MSSSLLIDALVHQLARLVAKLAVEERSSLAHVADRFHLHLVQELRSRGLGHKVIADIFGLPLRTYHERIKHLDKHRLNRSKTIRDVMIDFVHKKSSVSRDSLDLRFRLDDERIARSILRDLVKTGVLERKIENQSYFYRIAGAPSEGSKVEQLDALVLIALQDFESAIAEEVADILGASHEQIAERLAALVKDGRIKEVNEAGEVQRYARLEMEIGYGEASGRDAAIFDHVRAMVSALIVKLEGKTAAERKEEVGGSTCVFDLSAKDPLVGEVTSLLQEMRDRASGLRKRVLEARAGKSDSLQTRVTLYVGQWVQREETL